MGELVCYQLAVGMVGAERDLVAERECLGAEVGGCLAGTGTGMGAHIGERGAETRFHLDTKRDLAPHVAKGTGGHRVWVGGCVGFFGCGLAEHGPTSARRGGGDIHRCRIQVRSPRDIARSRPWGIQSRKAPCVGEPLVSLPSRLELQLGIHGPSMHIRVCIPFPVHMTGLR